MDKPLKIACTSADGKIFLSISDIYCIESYGNHAYVVYANKEKQFVTNSLRELTDRLSDYGFCRIHRQFLINISKIHKYQQGEGNNVEMENGIKYPLSKTGKLLFAEMVKK
ncbi:MAG: LytTR family DNA-binding domain-containing protein [Saprospiraceae bacterium]